MSNTPGKFLLVIICLVLTAAPSAGAAILGAELAAILRDAGPQESLPILVELREQVDLRGYDRGRESAGEMILALRETAQGSQPALRDHLALRGVSEVKSFWINNSLALAATPALIEELLGRDDVAVIRHDAPVGFDGSGLSFAGDRNTEWNLAMVRVDEVWAQFGLAGADIVLGSMDTGAEIDHPALAGKWRGGANSWIDIVNGLPAPYDDHGHGTHTIGTMVGGDGPGPFTNDIGMAFEAQFISAKVLDENNSFSTASIVIDGAQWMLDPDGNPGTDDFPHVSSNSWYFFSNIYDGFHSSAAAWLAAGIVPVFCQGNSGPNLDTTHPPGNYNNTIGVGATTDSDAVWTFSSRGPSPAGPVFPADFRKPDLSAPGHNVRSAYLGGIYAIWSGTSMATPHIAAAAGLMLQADPTLGYEEIRQVLLDTAVDIDAPGYDYNAGYGRLDAYAAVAAVHSGSTAPGDAIARGSALQVAPNPFREQLRIRFAGSVSASARLTVFDVQGRRLTSLAAPDGSGEWLWDGRDNRGRRLPAGVYLIRMADGKESHHERVLLLR